MAFGKGERFTNKASQALVQGVEPALDMGRLAGSLVYRLLSAPYREAVDALHNYDGVKIYDQSNEYVNAAIDKIITMISTERHKQTPQGANTSHPGYVF